MYIYFLIFDVNRAAAGPHLAYIYKCFVFIVEKKHGENLFKNF